ncbi:TIGR03759 family integrating conjugative element protein [Gallibacterium melopsittaci]|uniref:TIGR03759 family integrating conjugative element protein n=1 Tax=Gallibacterium melopsittaci TaxID=516063 RepID=A0ABV6I0J4_9PAST
MINQAKLTAQSLLIVSILMCSTSVFAISETLTQTFNTAKETAAQAITQAEQRVSSSLQALTTDEQAKQWGLTNEEWQRYQQIRKSERQYWSPNLDPLTTLGIEAKTDTERQKYARLLAKKEFERVEKELKFQLAYDAAFKELYPNISPISQSSNTENISIEGRLVFFTRLSCNECNQKLRQLIQQGKSIDIYFVDSAQNDKAIRDWAVSQHIDINKVRSRQITLNHDQGMWLQHGQGKIPVIFKAGTWDRVYGL